MKIILDANFLIYCAKKKIDYKDEIISLSHGEIVVPSLVLAELKELKNKAKKAKDKDAAELALKLLVANEIKIIDLKGDFADKVIIDNSKGNIVASIDREIQNKVERCIIVRADKKIDFL